MSAPRRATLALLYNGKDAEAAGRYFDSFKYNDVASGSSDDISLEFSDRDKKWINAWFPVKGDKLKPTIVLTNWEKEGTVRNVACGTFEVDDFSFKGGPIRMTMKALAISSASGFKETQRTQTYENQTLTEIASKVAKRNGLTLSIQDAPTLKIEKVAQDETDDCSFLSDLVTRYGMAMKIYNEKLVIFSEATYETKKTVASFTPSDVEPDWTWNTKLVGTYTGVKYQYANSEKNLTFTVEAGSGSRILTFNEAADSLAEATAIALAALNNANKGTTTMKVTLKANHLIIATSTVEIKEWGKLSGKYFVENVAWTLGGGGGCKQTLTLRKIETRITKATKATQAKIE